MVLCASILKALGEVPKSQSTSKVLKCTTRTLVPQDALNTLNVVGDSVSFCFQIILGS